MGVIAGYGIMALTKIPADLAIITAFSWIIVWMQVHGLATGYLVTPVETDIWQRISAAFFPPGHPLAGTQGKLP
jgi:hypothetical protein